MFILFSYIISRGFLDRRDGELDNSPGFSFFFGKVLFLGESARTAGWNVVSPHPVDTMHKSDAPFMKNHPEFPTDQISPERIVCMITRERDTAWRGPHISKSGQSSFLVYEH
jgi:hypothetical protein